VGKWFAPISPEVSLRDSLIAFRECCAMPVSSPARVISIFFSYATTSTRDKRLYDELIAHLSLLRRQQPIDEWYDSAMSNGSPITSFVETRLNTADIIILLVSPDFFASDRCYNIEMQRALERSEAGATRLIPVLLRPSEWEITPLSRYRPLPADRVAISRHSDRDDVLVKVAQGIRQVVKELAAQTTTPTHLASRRFSGFSFSKFSVFNAPLTYNNLFTNRDSVLATISSFFASTHALTTPILALSGMGGIGKTQIALAYSYRASHDYKNIVWLHASSRPVLGKEVSALADQLSLPYDDREDESLLFASMKRWLQDQSSWLLVLDQLMDMALLDLIVPAQSGGHVLLTTRSQATGKRASTIPITSMSVDASTLFLLRRAKLLPAEASLDQIPADLVRDASAIAQAMGGFPLALDQAGAYLEEKGCSPATYLALYQQQRAKLLSERGRLADDHRESVTSTLELAFAQVAQKNAANLYLLYLLAFLHPDAIPEELLTNGAPALSGPLQPLADDALALHQALADLRSFSLIHYAADRTTLQIQRIVQDVLIDRLDAQQRRQWARQAVHMVNHVFPEIRYDTWADCERYLPQARHCATLISKFHLTSKVDALLLERLGTYCSRRAFYAEAETYLTRALHLLDRRAQTNLPDVAQTLNSLALLYYRQAHYQEAEAYHRRALELRERVLGPDHPKTAESLHNLAMLYGDLGEYQRAEQLYQRVLSIEERTKGTDHADVARTLNNLGLIYFQQERYAQAEAAYRRTLTIYEHTLSNDHPDLIYPLDGLGEIAEVQDHYQQARELYQRAFTICEHAFGELHPETAHSLNKLADIAESQGNDQQAEELYQRALAIAEQVLRPGHPDIALFLNNLAFLANKQGQVSRARDLYQRSLHIYEQALGPQHPDTVSVREKYTALLKHIGEN
jgi:tetratricopeptide (TPR) repeat protein